jgi:hypothetical protein
MKNPMAFAEDLRFRSCLVRLEQFVGLLLFAFSIEIGSLKDSLCARQELRERLDKPALAVQLRA